MKPRQITCRGIIYKDNKIFAQQLTPDCNGNERDFWCTPGGSLEENESIVDGVKRELVEETGIEPKVGRLLFVQQYKDGNEEFVEFFFLVENSDDYLEIDLNNTSHGLAEIKNCGFIDPKENDILPGFLKEIDIQKHIEESLPVYFVKY